MPCTDVIWSPFVAPSMVLGLLCSAAILRSPFALVRLPCRCVATTTVLALSTTRTKDTPIVLQLAPTMRTTAATTTPVPIATAITPTSVVPHFAEHVTSHSTHLLHDCITNICALTNHFLPVCFSMATSKFARSTYVLIVSFATTTSKSGRSKYRHILFGMSYPQLPRFVPGFRNLKTFLLSNAQPGWLGSLDSCWRCLTTMAT
jgi:hypothetical protein